MHPKDGCIRISWGIIKINGVKETDPLVGGSEEGQSPPFYSKIPTTFLCTPKDGKRQWYK